MEKMITKMGKRLVVGLVVGLILVGSGKIWGQSSGFLNYENATLGSWGASGSSESEALNSDLTNVRTGAYSVKLTTTSTSANKYYVTNALYVGPSTSSNYHVHLIGWFKLGGSSTDITFLMRYNTNTPPPPTLNGSSQSTTSTSTTLTSNWTRVTGYLTTTSIGRYYMPSPNRVTGVATNFYMDDVIMYVGTTNTTDLTKPGSATTALGDNSGLTWTNGTDTGTGATGIQATLIFKRTGGSNGSNDLVLNDQGQYSLTSTIGPSVVGNWTLQKEDVSASATTYTTGTFTTGTEYAIVHRDLAYNYSAPTYVVISASCTPATTYTVSGTTSITSGSSTDITLSDSEIGIDYQLYKGGVAEGDPKAGTGEALVWSVSPTATSTYTVKTVSTTTYCETAMEGSAVITVTENIPVIELTSASGTNTQFPTVNTTITTITYSLAGGTATTANVTWTGTSDANTPPTGISVNFSYPTLTISGTPTVIGNYGYTATTDGDPAAQASGSINVVKYAIGDYESVANANWGVATTWKKWNGSGFTNPSPESPNSSSANVYIAAGTTVNYATGGNNMKNLIVEGTLTTNSLVNNPLYLNVYGDVLVASGGVIGNISNLNGNNSAGISISTYGTSTQTISGSGTISISRLRLNSANTVVIDADMYINYHGSSNTGNASALYPMQTGSTLIINEGKTVTMDRWSCIYLNTSSTSLFGYNFNMNINGTLNFLPGSPTDINDKTLLKSYLVCNVSTNTNTFAINIGENGTLTVNDLYLNGNSQTGTSTGITSFVNNGTLNIRLMGDFSRNASQTITGTGTVNLLSGAEIKIANGNGLDNTNGNIRNSTVNYNSGANYNFTGASSSQVTGANFPLSVNNLTIDNSSNVTLSAPLTVNGTLTLIAGELITGNNKLTINGTTSGTGTINNTNETIEYSGTTAQVISNIKDNTLNNLLINNTAGVTIDTDLSANTVTVNPGSKLTIADGKTLTVSNNTLKLLSSESGGTATVLGNVSGNAEVEQNLSAVRNWYMSSPVATGKMPAAGHWYNETLASNNWEPVSANADMTVGRGYIVVPVTTGNVSFSGALNNGNQSIALTRTDANTSYKGFNLVGNPYPSFLNAATFLSENSASVDNNIWYRTHTGTFYQFQTYNSISDVSVPKASNGSYIPPMQAFWVRAKADGVNLDFTNAMRKHNDSTVVLPLRAPKAPVAERQYIRLEVGNGSITDELLLYSDANASNTYDMYDSPKMMNSSNSSAAINLYTTVGAENLVIDGRNTLPLDVVIPVTFTTNAYASGSYTIAANELTNLPSGVTVRIIDNGVETSLSDGGTYNFTADAGTTKTFGLILRSPGAVTGFENGNADNCHVYVNANRQIVIMAPVKSNYAIYNALGQLIQNGMLTSELETLNTKLSSGVYVVKTENQSTRVIVK